MSHTDTKLGARGADGALNCAEGQCDFASADSKPPPHYLQKFFTAQLDLH